MRVHDVYSVRAIAQVAAKKVGCRRAVPRSGNENKRFIILLKRVLSDARPET